MVLVTRGWIYHSVNDDKLGKINDRYFTTEFIQRFGLFAQYTKSFKIYNILYYIFLKKLCSLAYQSVCSAMKFP